MLWLLVALFVLNLVELAGIVVVLYYAQLAARDLENGLADSIAQIDEDVKTVKRTLTRRRGD